MCTAFVCGGGGDWVGGNWAGLGGAAVWWRLGGRWEYHGGIREAIPATTVYPTPNSQPFSIKQNTPRSPPTLSPYTISFPPRHSPSPPPPPLKAASTALCANTRHRMWSWAEQAGVRTR